MRRSAGTVKEISAKKEYDSDGEDVVRAEIVGLEGKMAVPVHILSIWPRA